MENTVTIKKGDKTYKITRFIVIFQCRSENCRKVPKLIRINKKHHSYKYIEYSHQKISKSWYQDLNKGS